MSTDQEIYNLKKDTDKYFWLLLIYSLLPGIYKIIDNQLLMLGSIPTIVILLNSSKKNIKNYNYDIPFLFFLSYIFLQSIFCFFSPITNKIGLMMGIYMNIIPMIGYFISKGISFNVFSTLTLKIVLIHCVIGIILYPVFDLVDENLPFINTLREGVAIGRMASVSGSLGFGNLLMIGFIISFYTDKRYLLPIGVCLILSLQRSAWLGGVFAILLYLFFLIKQMNIAKIFKLGISFAIIITIGLITIKNCINLDLSYLTSRIQTMHEASDERSDQWNNGVENFIMYPLGTGSGQVGQFASRYDEAHSIFKKVPDGDYFRILSEHGIVGAFFYLYVIITFFISLFFININLQKDLLTLSLVGGELIQMLGSNVSEFYFTNFIYWMIFGYYFMFLGNKYRLKINKK